MHSALLERADKVGTLKEKTRYTRILFDSRAFVRTACQNQRSNKPALVRSKIAGACPTILQIYEIIFSADCDRFHHLRGKGLIHIIGICRSDFVNHIHALCNLAECGILPIQMRRAKLKNFRAKEKAVKKVT